MGIFDEQSSNQHYQFAKGIQGNPGVGFNLTTDGNYDMVSKKLKDVGEGIDQNDAVTKKQLDNLGLGDNVSQDIDLKNSYNVIKSKKRTFQELSAARQSAINFEEVRENFVGINEAFPTKNYLDMGANFIYNVKSRINNDQGANKGYVDSAITADYQKRRMLI